MYKILHILSSPRAEGTPRLVLDWLALEGYDQQVLFLESYPNDLINYFPENRYILNKCLLKGFRKIFQIWNLVKEVVITNKPDIVVCWNTGLSPWVMLGAKYGGISKLITHCGNAPGNGFLYKYIYTYITFWINKLVGAKIICCSKYIKDEYCKLPFVPVSIVYSVYNCVNTSRFQKKKHNKVANIKKAIMVATFEPHKDHNTLLEAWKIIENKGIQIELLLIGKGSLEGKLKAQANELGLKSVRFLGTRNDIPELMASADIFIFSTTPSEGFGTVLIEAMAAGLDIIASDVPACKEVLNNGEYGLLVEPLNPEILANSIIEYNSKMAIDDERIDKLYKYAQTFSPDQMVRYYIEISENKYA